MYIIIAGGGVVGQNLAKELVKDHDVVVIDIDQDICERIYSEYGAVSINGNATNVNVLEEAGIEKCDVAVAVTGDDANNLAFTVLAKNYDVEQILVRMREPGYESAYKLAGATSVAGVVDMMVEDFVLDIEQPDVRKLLTLSGGKAEISMITIPEDAICAGKKIFDITTDENFPDGCLLAGIFDEEEDELIIPDGASEVQELNQVFLVGAVDVITKAANFLTRTE